MERNSSLIPYLSAHVAYTHFDPEATGHKYLLETSASVQEIQKQYSNIHFKFNPSIQDIRPFLWKNFIAIQRYTYVVDLVELNEQSVLQVPEFKKIQTENFQLLERDASEADLLLHLNFLKGRILKRRWNIIHKDLFSNLSDISVLNIIDSHQKLKAQMLFNKRVSRAEQIFYWEDGDFKKNRGGIFAQYFFMLHFKRNDYKEFDFCGANIKSIAQFKSRFPVELKVIYELWYHRNPIKQWVRKYLFHQI